MRCRQRATKFVLRMRPKKDGCRSLHQVIPESNTVLSNWSTISGAFVSMAVKGRLWNRSQSLADARQERLSEMRQKKIKTMAIIETPTYMNKSPDGSPIESMWSTCRPSRMCNCCPCRRHNDISILEQEETCRIKSSGRTNCASPIDARTNIK